MCEIPSGMGGGGKKIFLQDSRWLCPAFLWNCLGRFKGGIFTFVLEMALGFALLTQPSFFSGSLLQPLASPL